MKIFIPSEDHLGLNSQVYKTVINSPYYTIIDFQNNKIKKVINIDNEDNTKNISDIIDMFLKNEVDIIVCNEISKDILINFIKLNIKVISKKLEELLMFFMMRF